jgi:hypothetical protein
MDEMYSAQEKRHVRKVKLGPRTVAALCREFILNWKRPEHVKLELKNLWWKD